MHCISFWSNYHITFRHIVSEILKLTPETFPTVKSFVGINQFQLDILHNSNSQLPLGWLKELFLDIAQLPSLFYMGIKRMVK